MVELVLLVAVRLPVVIVWGGIVLVLTVMRSGGGQVVAIIVRTGAVGVQLVGGRLVQDSPRT